MKNDIKLILGPLHDPYSCFFFLFQVVDYVASHGHEDVMEDQIYVQPEEWNT